MTEDELTCLHGIKEFAQIAKSLSYEIKEIKKNTAEYFTAGNAPESSVVRSNCTWITAI